MGLTKNILIRKTNLSIAFHTIGKHLYVFTSRPVSTERQHNFIFFPPKKNWFHLYAWDWYYWYQVFKCVCMYVCIYSIYYMLMLIICLFLHAMAMDGHSYENVSTATEATKICQVNCSLINGRN